jgi:flagellin-like hook-associated protein FlgL
MSDVVLSRAVRSNLMALQQTADLISTTQTRLATGKRVNSALDNPTNFFTASSLNSRAGDLGNLLDSVSKAIKTIEAADNGIKSLTKLIESAQATARQALQSTGTTAKVTGTVSSLSLTTTSVFSNWEAGDTLTVNDGTTTGTYTYAAGDDVSDLITAINNTASLNVRASLSGDGRIQFEAVTTNVITLGGTSDATEQGDIGFTAGTTAAGTLNTTRSSLATQFDQIRTQINQLSADSGYNGKNLLNGDSISVVFNERSTSSLSVSGVTYTATGLGIAAAAGTFQTDKDINDALDDLTSALTTLRSQASTFGSSLSVVQTRQEFTRSMINTLKSGADNLVLADTNEEGANLLALQTRQQLSTTALSLASQADQQVLRLF